MSAKVRILGVLAFVGVISASLVPLFSGAAFAQEKYPSRPIDFIVTWGAGGGADAMARTIGQHAQPILGVAIPVSNVPGASGNTGLGQLMAAKARRLHDRHLHHGHAGHHPNGAVKGDGR